MVKMITTAMNNPNPNILTHIAQTIKSNTFLASYQMGTIEKYNSLWKLISNNKSP